MQVGRTSIKTPRVKSKERKDWEPNRRKDIAVSQIRSTISEHEAATTGTIEDVQERGATTYIKA